LSAALAENTTTSQNKGCIETYVQYCYDTNLGSLSPVYLDWNTGYTISNKIAHNI